MLRIFLPALVSAFFVTTGLSTASADLNQDESHEKESDEGIFPVDVDASYELVGSDTVSSRGWQGYVGYVRQLSRKGRWASFYGGGLLAGKSKVTSKSTMAVEHHSFGGAELRFGGALMHKSVKLLQAHVFVDGLYAEDAIEEGGFTYRAGATLSWNTVGKFILIGRLVKTDASDPDYGSGQSDRGLGIVLGLIGAAALVIAPTDISVFVEDTPATSAPARYGISFGWRL